MEIKVFKVKGPEKIISRVIDDKNVSLVRREKYELTHSLDRATDSPNWYESDLLEDWTSAKKERLLSFWNRTVAHQVVLKDLINNLQINDIVMIEKELYCLTNNGWKSSVWQY
ncbi:hypothetical protein CVD28_05505 [Bacillus sp. M6-12]|uniref:hypothetical protein n=1 Tax=Bacillus sp. M6-12 TaxID=2054166 RepID=UPI000C77D96E|nr:hypothetical protein [Bacillus sp. M6-12]PLS18595.1 hypothetical protein CVD28_05505 [Bacillus sp. M6-12]